MNFESTFVLPKFVDAQMSLFLFNFKLGFRQLRTYFKSNICFLSNNTMRRNVTLQFLFCHDDTNDYVQHGLN